jgi:hypothetical protein
MLRVVVRSADGTSVCLSVCGGARVQSPLGTSVTVSAPDDDDEFGGVGTGREDGRNIRNPAPSSISSPIN